MQIDNSYFIQIDNSVFDRPFKNAGIHLCASPLKGIILANKNLSGIFHIHFGLFTSQGKTSIFLNPLYSSKNLKELIV